MTRWLVETRVILIRRYEVTAANEKAAEALSTMFPPTHETEESEETIRITPQKERPMADKPGAFDGISELAARCATPTPVPAASERQWSVWRKPRQGGDYVMSFEGGQADVEVRYGRIVKTLRQGGVLMKNPEGLIVQKYGAPNLRTRW